MYYIGIDLGGTHIAAGIVDDTGSILAKAETPTLVERPYQEVIADMAVCVRQAADNAGVSLTEAVPLALVFRALLTTAPDMSSSAPTWAGPISRYGMSFKHIDLPIYIDNDATVAGFAESVAGVSKGSASDAPFWRWAPVWSRYHHRRPPWTGAHGVASEIGHLTMVAGGILAPAGRMAVLERYCSATALIRMARKPAKNTRIVIF